MSLKVYYDLMSQPCRALLLFLKANSIPFESKIIALRKGEHMTPEYTKLNPLQKVPIIEDKGFILTESIAIIRYLARQYDIQDHWYPKDSKLQARIDEYLEWQHLNTRLFGSMIFRTRVIAPVLEQKPFDNNKFLDFQGQFVKALKSIEIGYLRDNPFLCGDKISVADLFGACEIEQPLATGFNPLPDFPKVKVWLERVQKEMDPHYSEVHSILKMVSVAIAKGKL